MFKNQQNLKHIRALPHYFFYVSSSLIVLLAFGLAFFYDHLPQPEAINKALFIPEAFLDIVPKPKENFIFGVLLAMTPITVFILGVELFQRFMQKKIPGLVILSNKPDQPCAKLSLVKLRTQFLMLQPCF